MRGFGGLFAEREQLALQLDAPPRSADELLARLTSLGLEGITRCRLTTNRTVMVSYRGGELRVHRGYLVAPEHVLRAIVLFAQGRGRATRQAAREVIVSFRIERPPASRRAERTLPDDEPLARTLAEWHARFNAIHFAGALRAVPIRVSRRLKSRLGHYSAAGPNGEPPEIVVGRSHIRRHGWEEALHTLLHEMVHQWQDETGHAIDHGRNFRAKAREVGVTPAARRTVPPRQAGAESLVTVHSLTPRRAASG